MSARRVSILLPCFNARAFLEERMDSILVQTFSDWEAIVLDSYSTDGSWEFFKSIASNDSRFRLHQVPREGLYAALNRGIKLATGEFLHIATCDDAMLPDFLATLLEALAICPEAGIAACDVSLINRDGGQLTREDMASYLPAESVDDGACPGRRSFLPHHAQSQLPATSARLSSAFFCEERLLFSYSAADSHVSGTIREAVRHYCRFSRRFGLAPPSDKPRRNSP